MTAIYAHRGCHGVPAPRENTLAAFRAARCSGADGVELDVRVTADGALAVLHDSFVPGVGDVADAVAAALPPDVPLLGAALAACSGLRVNVEIKGGPAEAARVAGSLRDRGPGSRAGPTEVLVSSFDPESLAAAREVLPGVACGLLVDWRADAAAALERAAGLGCATLHPFVAQVDADLVDAARERGLGLHVWTVNSDADIAAMGSLGVQAVITDRVSVAIGILRPGGAGSDGGSGDGSGAGSGRGSGAGSGAGRGGGPVGTPARNGGERAG